MAWTKRQFISQAFEALGLASYVFDMTPEQFQSAARQLDAMMAKWNGEGLRLGYSIPSSPANANDLDTSTGIPDSANEAVYLNLALRLSPTYGKASATELILNAKAARQTVMSRFAQPVEQQYSPYLPRGAGNKSWREGNNVYVPPPDDPIESGGDGELEFT